jgi:asparagine synthase (glutamine-hydrolysing)
VPLACFLSGGVDSSLIAHYAKRRLGRLTTLCVRMPDARYDESRFAEAVARHLGTDHVTVECPTGGADDLVRLVQQMGLPLGDSSLLPTHWVSRAASEHVRVALSGDGGDELFLGYERYRAASLLKRWHRLIAIVPPGLFSDADPKSRAAKIRRFVSAARCGSPYLSAAFGGPELRELIGPAQFDAIIARNDYVARRWFDDDPASSDTRTYLPDDLLIKVDSASMACGLEVRAPMLATALGEAALGATLLSLMPHGQRKGLLRQVARRYLPAEIVDRPKMGFAIPIGEWFRSDYGGLRTMLLDHLNSAEPFGPPSLGIELNMRYVRQMLDEHLGTGPGGRVVRDHSQRLYMLLVLSIWAKWVGSLGRG